MLSSCRFQDLLPPYRIVLPAPSALGLGRATYVVHMSACLPRLLPQLRCHVSLASSFAALVLATNDSVQISRICLLLLVPLSINTSSDVGSKLHIINSCSQPLIRASGACARRSLHAATRRQSVPMATIIDSRCWYKSPLWISC